MFSSLSEKRKSKNIILLKKTKRSSLEVIPSFLCEKNVKARIRSSIHDLKWQIWLVKQPIEILDHFKR